ncbi:hypothetical protein [Melaminivora sp.]
MTLDMFSSSYRLSLAAAALAMLAGCASLTEGGLNGAPASKVAIEYPAGSSAERQAMAQAALLPAFERYWATHAARDWKRLYTLETADRMPGEDFYVAYHARAWPLLSVQVVDLQWQEDGSQAVLTLGMRLRNPDKKGREEVVYRKDRWVRPTQGGWVHQVTDPMLIGVH